MQFLLDVEDHPDLDTMLGSFATEVVIDHMGRPDPRRGVNAPGFQALTRLLKSGRGWVKLSAPYRTSLLPPPYADLTPFAHALVAAAPGRLVWGSDCHMCCSKRKCRTTATWSISSRCGRRTRQYARASWWATPSGSTASSGGRFGMLRSSPAGLTRGSIFFRR